MTVFQSRFNQEFTRKRTITEMAFNTVLMLIICALGALILIELPIAIDAELKLKANPAPLLTVEQRTSLAHGLIVRDYEYLKTKQSPR